MCCANEKVSLDMMQSTDWFKTLLSAAGKGRGVGDWSAVVQKSEYHDEPAWQLGDGMDLWVRCGRNGCLG